MADGRRVGVLVGGFSTERDLSLRAGDAVVAALRERGHHATPIFVDRHLDLALRQTGVEVAFPALRGRYGADGCVQGLLETLGVPYVGSGVLALAIASHRGKTRDVLRLHNLPTAPAYLVRCEERTSLADVHAGFGYPVRVRPVGGASGHGVSLAADELELEAAVEDAFAIDEEVLVERYVDGKTVAVAVLDGVPLAAGEIAAEGDGASGGRSARPHVPPRISPARYRSLLRMAGTACQALGCEGATLIEMSVSERQNEVIVEIDAAPALGPTAVFPRLAAQAALGYGDLMQRLLAGARLRAYGQSQNRRHGQRLFPGPERRVGASAPAH